MIGFDLDERQRALQQMAHDFAAKEIRPVAAEYERRTDPRECVPIEVIKKGNELGFATLMIPEEHGGFGASDLEYAIFMEEIGWGDAGMYLNYVGHNIDIDVLKRYGTEEQKRKWFGKIVDDKTLLYMGCTASTEHGVAGDMTPRSYREKPGQGVTVQDFFTQSTVPHVQRREMTKTARQQGDNYVLNGMARFVSYAGLAKFYSVSAKLDPDKPDRGNTANFLIEWGAPGLSIGHIEDKVGLRTSQQAEVVLDNVVVPAENMIARQSPPGAPATASAFAGDSGSGVGLARAAFEAALEYAQVRYKNGNRIIFHQAVQLMLVDMFVGIQSSRLLLWKACVHNDTTNRTVPSPLPNLAKAVTSDVAMDVTTKAVQIFGGYGLMREFPVEKWFRDAKCMQIQRDSNPTVYADHTMPYIVNGTGF